MYTTAAFTMNGGSFIGNKVSWDGGGVYNRGTFTMNNGTILENRANKDGGGVFNEGVFKMQGGSTITGNRKGISESAALNNAYLVTGKPITLTGALNGDIGVTMQTYGTAALGSTSPAYALTQSDTYR